MPPRPIDRETRPPAQVGERLSRAINPTHEGVSTPQPPPQAVGWGGSTADFTNLQIKGLGLSARLIAVGQATQVDAMTTEKRAGCGIGKNPIHVLSPSSIMPAISLAGTRVMNRMSVEGTVPGRSHYGGVAG